MSFKPVSQRLQEYNSNDRLFYILFIIILLIYYNSYYLYRLYRLMRKERELQHLLACMRNMEGVIRRQLFDLIEEIESHPRRALFVNRDDIEEEPNTPRLVSPPSSPTAQVPFFSLSGPPAPIVISLDEVSPAPTQPLVVGSYRSTRNSPAIKETPASQTVSPSSFATQLVIAEPAVSNYIPEEEQEEDPIIDFDDGDEVTLNPNPIDSDNDENDSIQLNFPDTPLSQQSGEFVYVTLSD